MIKKHCETTPCTLKKLLNNVSTENLTPLNKDIVQICKDTSNVTPLINGANFERFDFSKLSEDELLLKTNKMLENNESTSFREMFDMIKELDKRFDHVYKVKGSLTPEERELYLLKKVDLRRALIPKKYTIYSKIKADMDNLLDEHRFINLTTHGKLPTEIKQALFRYYDQAYINGYLRKGQITEEILQQCKLLDKGFELAKPLEKEAVVYRGVCAPNPKYAEHYKVETAFINSLQPGNTFKDRAYVSVATDSQSEMFCQFGGAAIDSEGVLMKIKLPKGTKCIYSGDEAVLPRNSKFKINDVEYIDGVKIVNCEYILPN